MLPSTNTAPTVLVVDDDEDLLVLLQFRLIAEGFNPIFSPNGANVVEIIAQRHPDLVLLDIHMQGVDGGNICRKIKTDPALASTRVVLFSANANIKRVSQECGADGYVTKPFDSDQFRHVFSRLRP
jgi:CheY-like chemotaxis protein